MTVAIVLLLIALLGAVGFVVLRRKMPRKKRSQFFSHTFDNSAPGSVPESLRHDEPNEH